MEVSPVSVVIPTRNRRAALAGVLAPLLADAATGEVIVIVDGDVDGSMETLTALASSESRLRPHALETNRGRSVARQTGLELARFDVVLFLDDDVIAEPGLVAGHARHHSGQVGLVVVGYMPVVVPDQPQPGDFATLLYAREYEAACGRYEQEPQSILTSLWGGNISMSRADALAVGMLSPGFENRYHEDTDLGLRCRAAGYHGLFDRRLLAHHRHERSWSAFLAAAYQRGGSMELLRRRHGASAAPAAGRPLPRPLVDGLTALAVPVGTLHPAIAMRVARALRKLHTARGAADMRRQLGGAR